MAETKGNALQTLLERPRSEQLSGLKVLIIEDSFDTRGLIKSHLMRFGIKDIISAENGSALLKADQPLDVDIVLTGYGLGNCHSGIELVQALDRARLLPVWCKVVFITNAEVITSTSHPFRYLKCEVLRKPVNPEALGQLLEQGARSIRRFKLVLRKLHTNQLTGLDIMLESVPRGELSPTESDELAAITMHLNLRTGKGNEAWRLASSISDEVFRATNKLSIAYALGDERKLKMTINMMQSNASMQKRCLIHLIEQDVAADRHAEAMQTLVKIPRHTHSLAETELYSLLMCESQGLEAALEMLTFKRGTSLENQFFRNAISMMMVKCILYVLVADPKLVAEMPELVEKAEQILIQTDWQKGQVDHSPEVPLKSVLLKLLSAPDNTEHQTAFRQRATEVSQQDPIGLLLVSVGAGLYEDKEALRLGLQQADEAMLDTEISPETLVNQMWFKNVFNSLFSEPERAREYNRIGIAHARADKPYPALKMFYLSYLCEPNHASIAINLLDTFRKLGMQQYWSIQAQALIKHIGTLTLRENEQRKFVEVQKKLASA